MKLSLHGPIITADPGILNGRNLSIKLPPTAVEEKQKDNRKNNGKMVEKCFLHGLLLGHWFNRFYLTDDDDDNGNGNELPVYG